MQRSFIAFNRGDGQGQLHCREHNCDSSSGAGSAIPLIMLHAAPGSARMLASLQERFVQLGQHGQRTISLDLPGMGDSDALVMSEGKEPDIADYAGAIQQGIETLHLGQYDVYGTLSGARIALELANQAGSRVRRVILDGIGIPKPEDLPELLEHYAPAFIPDINGSHLQSTFLLCRDQYLFYPWYARDAEHRRPNGLPSAQALHIKTMESLKSGEGFRPLIRAAFRYDVAAALTALKQPALISADGSAVRHDCAVIEFPPIEPLTCPPDLLDKRAARMVAFLA